MLLTILLFNWVGYRLVTGILQQHADAQLQAVVESNRFSDGELVEIRVPLNLPYQTDWKEFQAYEGSVRVDGVDYRYVKRKVEKGELVLLCLPNHSKTHLATARDQFFMLVNDLQHNGQQKSDGKPSTNVKNPVTEYYHDLHAVAIQAPAPLTFDLISRPADDCLPGITSSLIEPPDFVRA